MKTYSIVFAPEAEDDLVELFNYIGEHGSPDVAVAYTEAIDKAELRSAARETLREVGALLLERPRRSIAITGHTDAIGTDAYNQRLSERRAVAVKTWLVSKESVKSPPIATSGRGARDPVAPDCGCMLREPLRERSIDIALASFADGIESDASLLTAEGIQRGRLHRLPDVFAEDGDVDVLREPRDEAKGLGERRATLEEQARATRIHPVEQRIKRPADPEVFLDILDCRAKACGRLSEK